tara:strand:- start:5254 stop:5370 length:117 start_codon:yes stop_codon:yes gene_type:complete
MKKMQGESLLKGKQKNLPDAIKKRIIASLMRKRKQQKK